MKITTAWTADPNGEEMPTLLSAYDEFTFDHWGKVPEWHTEIVNKCSSPTREIILTVPDDEIIRAFEVATVRARITEG